VTHLTELALFTHDVDGVTTFYERLLGLEPTERSDRHAVFPLGELRARPRRPSRRTDVERLVFLKHKACFGAFVVARS
jgi:catechol-2,3-dioxygenase